MANVKYTRVALLANLPTNSANDGDLYFVRQTSGWYVWDAVNMAMKGPIVGPAGATGATGATGPPGANGMDGAPGTNGTNGTNGTDGAPGATGATGPAGPSPTGLPNLVLATDASGSSANTAALRSLVIADLPGNIPNNKLANSSITLDGDGTVFASAGLTIALGSTGSLVLNTQTANTFLSGPASGSPATPAFRSIQVGDLPGIPNSLLDNDSITIDGDGTIFTSGPGAILLGNSGTLVLNTQAAGLVLAGPGTGASAKPTFRALVATDVPQLAYSSLSGLPQLAVSKAAVASNFLTSYASATGLFTAAQPAFTDISGAATTGQLPTGIPNGNLAHASLTINGDGVVFNATGPTIALGSAGALALLNQSANAVLAGPTTGSAAAPTFRALVAGDIPTIAYSSLSGTPAIPTSFAWNVEGNATGNLVLANGAFSSTFNHTSAVAWLWANTTTATALTTNGSPLQEIAANYWTGSASAQDTWSISSALAAGANGVSTLSITHSGSTGAAAVSCNALTYVFSPSAGGNTTFTLANGGSTAAIKSTGGLQLSSSGGGIILLNGAGAGIGLQLNGAYGFIVTNVMTGTSTSVYAWSSSTTNPSTGIDTGISRLAAGSVAVGSGAAGNTSGQLTATTFTVAASASAPTSAGTAGTVGQIIAHGALLYYCSVTGVAGSATWNKLSLTAV